MDRIRGTQIKIWDETFAGTVRHTNYKKIYNKLSQTFDEQQIAVLGHPVPWIAT